MPGPNPQYSDLDSANIVRDFFTAYEDGVETGFAQRIGMVVGSDRETEDYKFPGQAAGLQQWIGGRQTVNPKKYSFTLTNVPYEDTMVIPVADLRRDKTGLLNVRVSEMARKAARHWDVLVSSEMEANNNSYDGNAFFATDHDESGTNQLNLLASTEVAAANVTTVATPTADECADIIVQTIGYMYTFTDDRSDPVNGDVNNFTIIVNSSDYWSALRKAISANNLTSGESNVVPSLGLNIDVVLNPRLTSTSDTFMYFFATDGPMKPYILQSELDVTSSMLGEGSDFAFDHGAHKFGIQATRTVGAGLWSKAARVTLS